MDNHDEQLRDDGTQNRLPTPRGGLNSANHNHAKPTPDSERTFVEGIPRSPSSPLILPGQQTLPMPFKSAEQTEKNHAVRSSSISAWSMNGLSGASSNIKQLFRA